MLAKIVVLVQLNIFLTSGSCQSVIIILNWLTDDSKPIISGKFEKEHNKNKPEIKA